MFMCSWVCFCVFFYCLDGGYASCLEIPTCYLDFFLPHLLTLCADCWHQGPFVPDTATFLTYIDRFSLSYLRATSPQIELLFVNGHISYACFEPFHMRCSLYKVQHPAGSQAVTRHAKPVEASLADLGLLPCRRAVTGHRPASLETETDGTVDGGYFTGSKLKKVGAKTTGANATRSPRFAMIWVVSAEDHSRLGCLGAGCPVVLTLVSSPKASRDTDTHTDDGTM